MSNKSTPRAVHNGPLRSQYASDADMRAIIALFVREMPARAARLSEYWECSDFVNLAHMVHQLRGAGAGYGFPSISEAAGRFEQGLKPLPPGASVPETPSLRDQFLSLLELCQRVTL